MAKVYVRTPKITIEEFDGSLYMVEKYNISRPHMLSSTLPETYLLPLNNPTIKYSSEKINKGDYIATGKAGEHWIIKRQDFKMFYLHSEKERD